MPSATDEKEEFRSRARFVVLLVTACFLVLFIAWIARVILLLLFAAFLVALLLTTAADWVHRKLKIPRSIALLSVLLSGIGLTALGVWLRGSEIAEQFFKLESAVPLAVHKVFAQLQAAPWGNWLLARLSDTGQLTSGFAFAASRIGGAVLSAATVIGSLLIISIAAVYFAAEPDTYLKGLRLLTPLRYQAVVERCLALAITQLRWWLLAKLVSMVAVGVLIAIGLWIIDIPLAGTLGIIAACLTFIPNIGPILSAVPAGLLAFAISPSKGLLTLGLFFAVHFLEGNFVTPLAERQIVKLPPGLTLTVQLFLATITGPLGIALAAPLTAAAVGIAHGFIPAGTVEGVERVAVMRSSARELSKVHASD